MSSRWEQIGSLFDRAIELPEDQRHDWLKRECEDPSIRAEVEQMLAANDTGQGLLDTPVVQSAQAPQAMVIPDRVGPYQLVREIGRGGMGIVYHAYDPRLGRSLALKFLPPELQAKPSARERFHTEARAAAVLDHPNICAIYDVGETANGLTYIAMAYCDGETLAQRLESGPLPIEEAIRVASQVARGLACAHSAGILHRDIKAANIIVLPGTDAKILDFGIAKFEGDVDRTVDHGRMGTLHYMAPEQIRSEPASHSTDMWALGIVLYEMLCGRRPFERPNEAAVLRAILEEAPEPVRKFRPEAPEWLVSVVERLLAKNPDDRFTSASDLVAALSGQHASKVAVRGNIQSEANPLTLTSFVGRERELAQLRSVLKASRLLTLTGPAGTGKTRLSIELARAASGDFSDGCWFVSLAALSDPAEVAPAIADAIGIVVPAPADAVRAVINALRDKRALIVLDNFEQVAGAAPVVHELISKANQISIVVTSRVALRVSGEHQFPVPPLGVPSQRDLCNRAVLRNCAAVQLFVERAQAALPSFSVTDDNMRAIAELCMRLDGLPLAIELAAARVTLFSPEAMLKRLSARFDLLKGGPRDRPARQRSLREAISWSYELLAPEEQRLFRTLGVFVNGATLEACEAVSNGDNLIDGMAALVEHSLVRQTRSHAGEPRFEMLESIRAFAIEQLTAASELENVQRSFCEYFVRYAETAEPELTGPHQVLWLDRLHDDHENLRAGQCWALSHDHVMALRFGAALWRFWLARGHLQEGRRDLDRIWSAAGHAADSKIRVRLLNGLATLLHSEGNMRRARDVLRELAELLKGSDDLQLRVTVLNNLGWVEAELAALGVSREICEEALQLSREVRDARATALAFNNLGWIAMYSGEFREAIRLHEEGLRLRREIGDQRGIAFAQTNVAFCSLCVGDASTCSALVADSIRMLARINDRLLLAWALLVEGELHLVRRDYDAARFSIERSRVLWVEGGNRSVLAHALATLARVHLEQQRPDLGEPLSTESAAIFEEIGGVWGLGRALQVAGEISAAKGDLEAAKSKLLKSIELRQSIPDMYGLTQSMMALSRVHALAGEDFKAAALRHAARQIADGQQQAAA
ncbi:MAG TPA: protein kinase [Terriglobales bacterium]|nr:protein kinase [Terriglobales bacterium]